MATSSIMHNFVIEGKERVERFANAVEASWNEVIPERPPVQGRFITDQKEAWEILERGLIACTYQNSSAEFYSVAKANLTL